MMTAPDHNRLVGIFLMVHGGMQALILLLLSFVYGLMGLAMMASGGGDGGPIAVGLIFIVMVVILLCVAAVFCGPQILGGYKLLKQKPNARTWGIIGSIVAVLSFPLGTAVGVYAMWFLFGDMGKQFYLQPGMPYSTPRSRDFDYQQQPPPPNSWQ